MPKFPPAVPSHHDRALKNARAPSNGLSASPNLVVLDIKYVMMNHQLRMATLLGGLLTAESPFNHRLPLFTITAVAQKKPTVITIIFGQGVPGDLPNNQHNPEIIINHHNHDEPFFNIQPS